MRENNSPKESKNLFCSHQYDHIRRKTCYMHMSKHHLVSKLNSPYTTLYTKIDLVFGNDIY